MKFVLRDFGSFYAGGRRIEIRDQPQRTVGFSNQIPSFSYNPNGFYHIEQAYIQYFIPLAQQFSLPVLLVHGGGLTGASWETTPDGRPGWLHYLLEAGIATYVIDNVERGRASWCCLPGIWPDVPLLRSEQEAWTIFKLGDPDSRVPFPGLRFPLEYLESLLCQIVPRWTTTADAAQAALEAAIKRIGPCALVAHSQGGGLALRAAMQLPQHVKAIVALEPHGFPDFSSGDQEQFAALKEMDLLFVLADFNEKVPLYTHLSSEIRKVVRVFLERGISVDLLDLPAIGITGNSHMIMMDQNNDEIVRLIISWLNQLQNKSQWKQPVNSQSTVATGGCIP